MSAEALRDRIVESLEDMKGRDIVALDVTSLTTMTDYMVIVSGTSNRHVKAMVDDVIDAVKKFGDPAKGVEGRESNEWVLLDIGDVIVHVMQKEAREFYELERLWTEIPRENEAGQDPAS